MIRYTKSHEWISTDSETQGTVGITDYAQKELGEIVYIELPKVNQVLKAGEEACVLESTKAAADVYAPVSGRVTAVNEALRANPSLINHAPEESGWLFKIDLAQPEELKTLLDGARYHELIH
jgi:glycine cleavage system H protein